MFYSGHLFSSPITQTFSGFPWRFKLSPVNCIAKCYAILQNYFKFSLLAAMHIFCTVKPDAIFLTTLKTSAAMLVYWLAVCSEQYLFAISLDNLLTTVANFLTKMPLSQQIPPEIKNVSWKIPKMTSRGRKSDKNAMMKNEQDLPFW